MYITSVKRPLEEQLPLYNSYNISSQSKDLDNVMLKSF
jgi:hypothetical protein